MEGFLFEAVGIYFLINIAPALRSTPRCVRSSLHCGVLAAIRARLGGKSFFNFYILISYWIYDHLLKTFLSSRDINIIRFI